jgi:hypothetical protein
MFDEDIKIAAGAGDSDGPFAPAEPVQDAAELAARDFLVQKDNGNIDRARTLGEAFARCLWELAQELIMDNEQGLTQQEIHHRLLLCSYAVNRVIAQFSPNSIVAQTALGRFYSDIEDKSNVLHRHVSDTAAFSLYILNERSGSGGNGDIGRIFAKLIGCEGDPESASQGAEVYGDFYRACKNIIDEVKFVAEAR